MNEIIKSEFHDIVIELTGWDEPNNGRVLHVCNLIVNGRVENEKYFEGWNKLDEKLDRITLDSPDKKFVFIPAESGGFLIEAQTLNKVKLPYKRISTVTFIGNYFSKNLLVLVHTDEIILYNLGNGISTRINFSKGNIRWSEINDKDELLITYDDKQSGGQLTEAFDYKTIDTNKE